MLIPITTQVRTQMPQQTGPKVTNLTIQEDCSYSNGIIYNLNNSSQKVNKHLISLCLLCIPCLPLSTECLVFLKCDLFLLYSLLLSCHPQSLVQWKKWGITVREFYLCPNYKKIRAEKQIRSREMQLGRHTKCPMIHRHAAGAATAHQRAQVQQQKNNPEQSKVCSRAANKWQPLESCPGSRQRTASAEPSDRFQCHKNKERLPREARLRPARSGGIFQSQLSPIFCFLSQT